MASDGAMRRRWVKFNNIESHYEEMAAQFDGSIGDAAANDFMNAYRFSIGRIISVSPLLPSAAGSDRA